MSEVRISRGVTKLGADIPCVNLPAVVTCRKSAPCCKECYANKGRFKFSNVIKRLQENLDAYYEDPNKYFDEVSRVSSKFTRFRYHSSGDIVDAQYLKMMNEVAKKNPKTSYLCFTKKFELVNDFVKKNGMVEDNLRIVFSCWKDFIPDNPYSFPTSWVKFGEATDENIPSDAKICSLSCINCDTCWTIDKNESVVFIKH